jgi:hypothetical protein
MCSKVLTNSLPSLNRILLPIARNGDQRFEQQPDDREIDAADLAQVDFNLLATLGVFFQRIELQFTAGTDLAGQFEGDLRCLRNPNFRGAVLAGIGSGCV